MNLLATTAALSVIIALRYLFVAAGLYWLLWRRGEPRLEATRLNTRAPTRAAVLHELRASLVSSPIYAFPAAVALQAFEHGRGLMYADPGRYGLWWLPVSGLVYLLVQDTYYYWAHRAMHHRWAFAWSHRGHHLSREPTPFASFAFDAAEAAATAWLLPALTFVVPIHVGVALGLLTLMTVSALLNHCGFELLPRGWVRGRGGALMISATHHSLHHTRFRCNYGLYFRAWDRLMGTDAMPAEGHAGMSQAPTAARSRLETA
jgi:sterol desaturase/sphingolipid hydroxylase (fatty acid hydroxylase superfamily)